MSCTALFFIAGARPAGAQVISATAAPGSRWTAEVTTGLLVQPVQGGGSGGALAVTLERGGRATTWSPALLFVVGRVPGDHGDNGYTMNRDWIITAVGADAFLARTERLLVSLGAKGGVLWNHDRLTAVGEHPFGPQGPTGWEQKAGLIIDGAGQYRIGRHLSLASRLGLVQQIFTDDFVGPSGALASLGIALDW